jgi:protein ImuA
LGSLIEILSKARGSGELALVAPALTHLPPQKPIVLLNPPGMPNALAWQQWRVASQRLWWIHPKNPTDACWSAETVLRSRAFGALLAWVDPIDDQALRRLHASVQDTDTLTFLFRPVSCATQFSPCPLRLTVSPTTQGLSVQILKSKGIKPAEPMTLTLEPDRGNSAETSHVDCHRTAALAP